MPKPIPPSISFLFLRNGLRTTPLRSSAHLRINVRPPHPQLQQPKRTIKTSTRPPNQKFKSQSSSFSSSNPEPKPKSKSHSSPSSFSLWTLIRFPLLPLLPIALVLTELTPYEILWVSGPSMTPYLNSTYHTHSHLARDLVLVKRGARDLKRGMVVVFRSPRDPRHVAVKRVVAVGGDRVMTRGDGKSVVVPWNHVWVEGDADDSRVSMDSNVYGCVSANLVTGVVVAVVRPWERARWVRWEEWEGGENGERQRGRVEKEAVRVYEPVTF